jgi:hypothetical protein
MTIPLLPKLLAYGYHESDAQNMIKTRSKVELEWLSPVDGMSRRMAKEMVHYLSRVLGAIKGKKKPVSMSKEFSPLERGQYIVLRCMRYSSEQSIEIIQKKMFDRFQGYTFPLLALGYSHENLMRIGALENDGVNNFKAVIDFDSDLKARGFGPYLITIIVARSSGRIRLQDIINIVPVDERLKKYCVKISHILASSQSNVARDVLRSFIAELLPVNLKRKQVFVKEPEANRTTAKRQKITESAQSVEMAVLDPKDKKEEFQKANVALEEKIDLLADQPYETAQALDTQVSSSPENLLRQSVSNGQEFMAACGLMTMMQQQFDAQSSQSYRYKEGRQHFLAAPNMSQNTQVDDQSTLMVTASGH